MRNYLPLQFHRILDSASYIATQSSYSSQQCIACDNLTIPATTCVVEGEAGQHQRWPGPRLMTVHIPIRAFRIDWPELPAVVTTASAPSYGVGNCGAAHRSLAVLHKPMN
jgi:hypothetical protein